jgi:hypothetical protein
VDNQELKKLGKEKRPEIAKGGKAGKGGKEVKGESEVKGEK